MNSTTQQPPAAETLPLPQQVILSDYDTDGVGYEDFSDVPKLLPTADSVPVSRTKEDLNFAVIPKWYPDVVAILSVAPFTTHYYFLQETKEWHKSGIAGTLFICQLTAGRFGQERYHAIVLNRSGLDNFDAELRKTEIGGVEFTDGFVMVTREDPEDSGKLRVDGLHIFAEEGQSTEKSRAVNGELMIQLAAAGGRSRDAAEKAYAARHAQTPNGHAQQYPPQPQQPLYDLQQHFHSQPQPQPQPQPEGDMMDMFRRNGLLR